MPKLSRGAVALAVLAFVVWIPSARAQPDPLPRAVPEAVGMSSEHLARIGAALTQEVEANRIPGAVVAIARRGRLVYFEAIGFQDRARGIPMRHDSIFAIASMTKPWIGTAAMMLVEDGRLALEDPIERFIPELANRRVALQAEPQEDPDGVIGFRTVRAARPITVLDLLRHTSGLTYGHRGVTSLHRAYPSSSNASSARFDASAFIAHLASLPLHFQPGMRWDYGLGIDVVGIAAERISGRSLGSFLEDRLFRPLGMTDSGFVVEGDRVPRMARTLPSITIPDRTQRTRFECGGGCGVSTASDYIRFAQMLLDGGTLDGRRVLSAASVRTMTTNRLGPNGHDGAVLASTAEEGEAFGLGVAIRPATSQPQMAGTPGEFGWSGAFGTNFWVDPAEGLAVVLMIQAPSRLHTSRRTVRALVHGAITR